MSSNPVKTAKTVTIKLDDPVEFEGATHDEITLRRLKGKDIKKLDRYEEGSEQAFFLMAELSGWPPEAFDDMDAADIEKVTSAIEGFTGKRPRRSRKA